MTRTNPLWPKHSQLPMVHQYIWPRTTCYPKTTTRRYKAIKKLLLKGLGHILNHNLSTHKNILAIFRSLFPNLKLVGALLLPYTATTTCQLKKPRSHPLSVKPIAFYARHSILMVLQLHSPYFTQTPPHILCHTIIQQQPSEETQASVHRAR